MINQTSLVQDVLSRLSGVEYSVNVDPDEYHWYAISDIKSMNIPTDAVILTYETNRWVGLTQEARHYETTNDQPTDCRSD